MHRAVSAGLVVLLAFSIVGCTGAREESAITSQSAAPIEASSAHDYSKDEWTKVSSNGLSVNVPKAWEVSDATDGKYITPDFGGLIYLQTDSDVKYDGSSIVHWFAAVKEGMEADGSVKFTSDPATIDVGQAKGCRAPIEATINGGNYKGLVEVIISGEDVYLATILGPADDYPTYRDLVVDIANSLEVKDSKPPYSNETSKAQEPSSSVTETTTTETAPADTAASETKSQRNAVDRAKSYLKHTAFSHDGLVEQLEYEEFSHEDAVYGVDHCGADWMVQAEKKAKNYLSHSAFSYSGLIEQLEYEGFTHDEAMHGVDTCGADWNEQAKKKAEQYMRHTSFSHDGLVEQLEFEGFTYEQAESGVSAAGL